MFQITPIARSRSSSSNRAKKAYHSKELGVAARDDSAKQNAVEQCLIDPITLTLQEVPRNNHSRVQPKELKALSDALDSYRKDSLLNK